MRTITPAQYAKMLANKNAVAEQKPRAPTGIIANALPEYWLAKRDDGGLWILGLTKDGDSRLLATIAPEIAAVVRAHQGEPLTLTIEEWHE